MNLTAEELRVLAALVEKSYTTPEQYPMSSNALTAACNQKTSRDPVVDYPMRLVDETLQLLRDAGWVRSGRGSGSRVFKHRHLMGEQLGLGSEQEAVLAVLALRGPQSAGELKTRTERYVGFADPAEVEAVLDGLVRRADPLVRNVGRASGQSHDRWIQLVGPTDDGAPHASPALDGPPHASPAQPSVEAAPAGAAPMAPVTPGFVDPQPETSVFDGIATGALAGSEVAELRQRIDELEDRLARLETALGVE